MNFDHFAQSLGLIINHVEFGKWVRCPTVDHPKSKNGAYKHLGDLAFCQNHATMTEVAIWKPEHENEIRIDREAIRRRAAKAEKELQENRRQAAAKAVQMISKSRMDKHPYLDAKGFPDASGLVYSDENLLLIPMRAGGRIVGCQTIDRDGNKKFLFGQQCKGAEYKFDGNGLHIWTEGYATAMSVFTCLQAMKMKACIHTCFSAMNMRDMAKDHGHGIIIADNDASLTGITCAKEAGLPYFMPPDVGDDFNDYWRKVGTFKAARVLKDLIYFQ